MNRAHEATPGANDALRREYATLCELQTLFDGDPTYGIVTPLGLLAADGHTTMVMQWFAGAPVWRYARECADQELGAAFRHAGRWLRMFHEDARYRDPACRLDAGGHIDYLRTTYGDALQRRRSTRDALDLLLQGSARAGTCVAPGVGIHGDFKPDNLLCDGKRYVGLDVQPRMRRIALYDLATFANHLWLHGLGGYGRFADARHTLAEAAFLEGYGDVRDDFALRWLQLYFALCQAGSYSRRGLWGAAFARFKIVPQIQRIMTMLRAAG